MSNYGGVVMIANKAVLRKTCTTALMRTFSLRKRGPAMDIVWSGSSSATGHVSAHF